MIDVIDRGDPAEEYMNGLADFDKAAKDRRAKPHEQLFDGEFYENLLSDDEPSRPSAVIPIVLVCAVVVLAFGVVWIF